MALIMVGTGIFVIGAGILVLLPLVVLDVYQAGLAAMSQVMITFWVGAAVATVALARFGHVERPGRTLVAAIGLGVASIAFLAFEIPFWSLYVLVFIWGLSGGVSIAMSRTIVQQHAPPEALARVLSIYQLGFMGGAPIGAVAVGYIVAFSDVRTAALFPLVGMAISLVWLAVFTPIFKLSDDSRK